MKFLPAEGYIAVVVEQEKKTASGIIFSDNALLDRMSKATVVSTSMRRIETTGEYLDPTYNLDDTVVFLKGNGINYKLDGVDLIIIGENEVLGKLID